MDSAKEISLDAAAVAVLSELGGISHHNKNTERRRRLSSVGDVLLLCCRLASSVVKHSGRCSPQPRAGDLSPMSPLRQNVNQPDTLCVGACVHVCVASAQVEHKEKHKIAVIKGI